MKHIPARQDALNAFAREYLMPESSQQNDTGHHPRNDHTTELSDEEIIAKCRKAKNAAKFADLFDAGDTSAYGGDDSRADQALASLMAFYTQDEGQLDRLFRRSALMRPKWDQKRGTRTYGQRTIDKALDGTSEAYQSYSGTRLLIGGDKADLRHGGDEEVSLSPSLIGEGHQGHPVPDKNHGVNLPRAAAFRELAQPEERRYLVGGGLVPAAYPTMIFGDGGSAKSLLAMSAGTAISTGAGLEEPPADFYYLSALGYPVRDAFRAAYAECRMRGIGMLILDSLGPALEGDAEASRDVIGFYSRVIEPFRALGVGVFMVDHQAKLQAGERYQSKRAFGSVFKTNLARSVIQVEARDREEGRLAITLRQTKHNFGYRADPFGVVIEFSEEQITVRPETLDPADLAEEGTLNATDRVRLVLEDGPKFPADIAEATGLAVKTVKNALTRLRKMGEVAATGKVEHQAEEVSLVSSSHKGQGQGHRTGNELWKDRVAEFEEKGI
jgi:hypothetical protein